MAPMWHHCSDSISFKFSLIARFMGSTWGPGGRHVGPMNFAIWAISVHTHTNQYTRKSELGNELQHNYSQLRFVKTKSTLHNGHTLFNNRHRLACILYNLDNDICLCIWSMPQSPRPQSQCYNRLAHIIQYRHSIQQGPLRHVYNRQMGTDIFSSLAV